MLTVLTFGCFPSVCFILAKIKQTLGKHPKVNTVNTEYSEGLKSKTHNVHTNILNKEKHAVFMWTTHVYPV
jgi:hypothetical protein